MNEVQNKLSDESIVAQVEYFIHVLRVFQAEMLVYLKNWDQFPTLIKVS